MRGDPWPSSVTPDFTDVEVAIARTIPASEDTPAVREVESLFTDAIRDARRWIYAENQYLTWPGLADALLERLAEADGPEVVLVVPREGCGWLEEQTMSMRRARVVERLRAAAQSSGHSMAALAMGWVLHCEAIDSVLVGARHTGHIDNALAALQARSELAAIAADAARAERSATL